MGNEPRGGRTETMGDGSPGASGPPDQPALSAQSPTEWDAPTYHRLSAPQIEWGQRVLARLPLRGDETVLDAGCGSGHLTARLLDRLPRGRVVAVDASADMLRVAAEHLTPRFGDKVSFVHADLQTLTLPAPVDAIFSTATFHWVPDHPRLFRHLFAALVPGGRLVAQCGGGPNLDRLRRRTATLMAAPAYAPAFVGWSDPWTFADAATTADRLRATGFVDVETSLEPAPTILADARTYHDFVTAVVLRRHLAALPSEASRVAFVATLTAQAAADDPPFFLDYWRLNLDAVRPAAFAARS
jgi:trans-aconitate 2-methyltransferase